MPKYVHIKATEYVPDYFFCEEDVFLKPGTEQLPCSLDCGKINYQVN